MEIHACTPAANGDHYIAPSERDGSESAVYFTRDLSAEGLRKAFAKNSAPGRRSPQFPS